MAIVFISPKKGREAVVRMGFMVLVAMLLAGSVFFLLPEIKDQVVITPSPNAYTAPDISINFELMDSPEVTNLDSFVPNSKPSSVGRVDPFSAY